MDAQTVGLDSSRSHIRTYRKFIANPTSGATLAVTPLAKMPGCETASSSPSSMKFKNRWGCTSIPTHVFMAWFVTDHKDICTFLVNDQLDALFFNVFISTPLHVSSSKCLSSGGPTCINKLSSITHSQVLIIRRANLY